MSFPHQRRVAPSNDDGIQQDNQTFSSPLQGENQSPWITNTTLLTDASRLRAALIHPRQHFPLFVCRRPQSPARDQQLPAHHAQQVSTHRQRTYTATVL